jgi:hypothetical protein
MGQGLVAQMVIRFGPASGDPFCEPFFLCRGEAIRSCVCLLLMAQKITVIVIGDVACALQVDQRLRMELHMHVMWCS